MERNSALPGFAGDSYDILAAFGLDCAGRSWCSRPGPPWAETRQRVLPHDALTCQRVIGHPSRHPPGRRANAASARSGSLPSASSAGPGRDALYAPVRGRAFLNLDPQPDGPPAIDQSPAWSAHAGSTHLAILVGGPPTSGKVTRPPDREAVSLGQAGGVRHRRWLPRHWTEVLPPRVGDTGDALVARRHPRAGLTDPGRFKGRGGTR